MDLVYVGLAIAFFSLTAGLVRLASTLGRAGQ